MSFVETRMCRSTTGTSVISEFYTPLVPKGHDFLKEIGRLSQNRQDGQAACEAKAAGTD